jgi:hypothetical protein
VEATLGASATNRGATGTHAGISFHKDTLMKTFVRRTRPAAAVLAVALVLTACGGTEDTEPTTTETSEPEAAETSEPMEEMEETEGAEAGITAELLRTEINLLLQEHVIFAGAATGAAIAGDEAGFNQAATAVELPHRHVRGLHPGRRCWRPGGR